MNKDLIIYGNGNFAELMKWYVDNEGKRKVVAVTVEREYIKSTKFQELPVVPFDEIDSVIPSSQADILVCVGYVRMNDVRKEIFHSCRNKGYKVASFIHNSVNISNAQLGEGNIILEGCLLQPFVKIGDGNILWYNVTVAHNSCLGNYNTVTGHTSICGFVDIKDNCFIGAGSVIRDKIQVGSYTLVGANTYIYKSTEKRSVWVSERAIHLDKISSEIVNL